MDVQCQPEVVERASRRCLKPEGSACKLIPPRFRLRSMIRTNRMQWETTTRTLRVKQMAGNITPSSTPAQAVAAWRRLRLRTERESSRRVRQHSLTIVQWRSKPTKPWTTPLRRWKLECKASHPTSNACRYHMRGDARCASVSASSRRLRRAWAYCGQLVTLCLDCDHCP